MNNPLLHVPTGKYSNRIFLFGWVLIAFFAYVIVFDAASDIKVSQADDAATALKAEVVSASQINLSWSAPENVRSGTTYKISRDGEHIGTTPLTNFQDTGLSQSTSYSYTVTAYDSVANAYWQPGTATAVTEIQITQISIISNTLTGLSANSAVISWETTFPSVGAVNYSVSQSNLTSRKADLDLSRNHSVTLTDLKANTKYYYRIKVFGGTTAAQTRLLQFRTLR